MKKKYIIPFGCLLIICIVFTNYLGGNTTKAAELQTKKSIVALSSERWCKLINIATTEIVKHVKDFSVNDHNVEIKHEGDNNFVVIFRLVPPQGKVVFGGSGKIWIDKKSLTVTKVLLSQ